ncbi:MAG: DnaJ C-terminal domain-containing protein [Nitrospiraceae bacterium]
MASVQRDYYDVLGVPRTATADEVKKAYRRLARQYHPDLHSGPKKSQMEQKFKEVNEAHEVLGDPGTRKKYDHYGHRWQEAEAYVRARQQAGAGAGMGPQFSFDEEQDFGDIFETLFGRGSRTGSGSAFKRFATPGADLEAGVQLTLREVLTGVTRRIQLAEKVSCTACGGTGHHRGRPCAACDGTGSRTEHRTIEVKIPAGVQDGTRVRVAGKGQPGRHEGRRGDLYLQVHVVSDGVFRRQGSDVHVTLPVWPWEAALGAEVLAPTLTDPVRVKVPPGSLAGGKLRLKGKGLPTASGGRGDLFFRLQIVMPSSLTDEDRKLYEQLGRARHPDPRANLLLQAGHS